LFGSRWGERRERKRGREREGKRNEKLSLPIWEDTLLVGPDGTIWNPPVSFLSSSSNQTLERGSYFPSLPLFHPNKHSVRCKNKFCTFGLY
jgi:hypothetical protein